MLMARGLSNADIARELVLEASTVKKHVANVLSKLDLSSRAQAVVFAYEHGLARPGHEGPLTRDRAAREDRPTGPGKRAVPPEVGEGGAVR